MRVGVVGAGWVTQYHLPAWAQVPGVEVVAICDPDGDAAAARAAAFGIPAHYRAAGAMLAETRLDVLDICSPRHCHAEQVRLGAAHGVAMMCQKPLAVDLAEAEALVAEVEDRVRLMVHENWRFRPHYRQLRGWLDEGLAGEIVAVRLDFHSSGLLPGADGRRPALVRQPFFRGLDRLLVAEVLIHHLDTLRFLLGELDLVAARLRRGTDVIAGEDSAILTLKRRRDGVPVAVSGNLAVHGAPPAPSDRLWLYGTQGTIELNGCALTLSGRSPRAVRFDPEADYRRSYRDAILHFVERLRGGAPFETAARDNLETLRLVEAAYRYATVT